MRTHGVLMAAWSRTGKVLCHSSCEAELVALHEGIVESKRLKSLMMEIGIQNVQITLVTDSSASIRVAMRRGLGRLKHIELKYISLQQDLRDGIIQLKFVPGANNQADALTKALPTATFMLHRQALGVKPVEDDDDEHEQEKTTSSVVLRRTKSTQLLAMVALSRLSLAATATTTAPLEENESANMSMMMFMLIVIFAIIGVVATLLLCCWLLVRRFRAKTLPRRLTPYYPNQLLYVTLTEHGKKYHSRQDCSGLARAAHVKTCKPCNVCFG